MFLRISEKYAAILRWLIFGLGSNQDTQNALVFTVDERRYANYRKVEEVGNKKVIDEQLVEKYYT